MFKKYSIKQMQLIFNIVSSINGDFENENNIDFMIAQAIPVLGKDNIDLKKMTNNEKIKFKTGILDEINKIMDKYIKFKTKKMENDKVYISYDGKDYVSSYINIKTYFFINKNVSTMSQNELSENVLEKIFEGIIPLWILEEIKEEEPIYWEILLEDTHNLILKTLMEIMEIETLKRPDCIKKSDEISELGEMDNDAEISLYSSFLENYNITPNQINSSKASDILNSLSIMSNRQIIRDVESYIKELNGDRLYKEAFIYQVKQQMKGGK